MMNKNLKVSLASWFTSAMLWGITFFTGGIATTLFLLASILMASNSLVYFLAYTKDNEVSK